MTADQESTARGADTDNLAAACKRVNRFAYLFGVLDLFIATPVNYVCAGLSYYARYGDLSDPPVGNSFLAPPERFSFVVACVSALVGLVALLVPRWLAVSEGGLVARRVIRAVAVAALWSVSLGVLGVGLAS